MLNLVLSSTQPLAQWYRKKALLIEEEQNLSPQGKKRPRKAKAQSLVVDSEVRRIIRVREKCNGFKPSNCKVANCLGCNLDPPTLSLDTLKNIGVNMCQRKPELLEEGPMNKKKPKPIAKKKGISKYSKEDGGEKEDPNKEHGV